MIRSRTDAMKDCFQSRYIFSLGSPTAYSYNSHFFTHHLTPI